ncbi:unnamed protein product [Rhodiola kirilowii]
MEKICVAIRVRPPVNDESSTGIHWKVEDNRISLHKRLGTPISGVSYAFDQIFDASSANSEVYELLTKDIVHAAVQGFNGTVFAYGQTSSGKTFTMNGSQTDPGVIHQAVRDIFLKIQEASDREFLVRVSYMEIYNEEINDLFAIENKKLQIHESLERGIYVSGLREEIVSNAEQVLQRLESGEANRHFGETNMNVRSSRSHTIFRMVIESKGKNVNHHDEYFSGDAVRVSVLNLVDLAGSERIAKTGAAGVRLKEGKHINKILMALGNVINKLSDGVKQRGHIPYRDSKLTRILQPALGGNAKTSIICTVAPEEAHVEETKGTLQFASRAKRITNCAQVNEILTDAALLKRQKLEIEELRKKLQGSRAEVLEQEILKLRNDMLKYELEREKLATELEEERKSHKEREKEQQIKTESQRGQVNLSDCDRSYTQEHEHSRQNHKEESSVKHKQFQEETFRTPCFKASPSAFVARRGNFSKLPDFSPLPNTFSNMADEDTWQKLNKGYVADLDSLLVTPARRVQSFPCSDLSPVSLHENDTSEVEHLKRQLELAIAEKEEIQRNHAEQVLLNNRLLKEISDLQEETLLIRQVPKRLCESVATCKSIYKDVMLVMQNLFADNDSPTAKLLTCTSEVGDSLFSTLESHFSLATYKSQISGENDTSVQQQFKSLSERLHQTVKYLALTGEEDSSNGKTYGNFNYKCSGLRGDVGRWKEEVTSEFNSIKEKYKRLESELRANDELLKASKKKYENLEDKFSILKAEKDTLQRVVSKATQELSAVVDEKEKVVKKLKTETHRSQELEKKIKQFSVALASRQRSLLSFHSEFKSIIENLKAETPISLPKSLGY